MFLLYFYTLIKAPTRKINYLYNATGQKVAKKITNNSTETMTDYLNGFHYENQRLMFFANSEGYVNIRANSTNGITAVNYVYNYTDHLGNIRVSYTFRNATGQPVIMEENHYYPFGIKHKKYGSVDKDIVCVDEEEEDCYEIGIDVVPPQSRKPYQYKYNYREYQDEFGLNWTSMDYRNYDNALGRFHSMDRLAELAPSITSYRFAFNNPVYWSDPTGLFESESAAMAHIKNYGLQHARAQYNERGYWEVESNEVAFHQSGNDFVIRYLNTSSGGVTVDADGVATIDEVAISQLTLKNGVINGGFGKDIEKKSSIFGEGLKRLNGFASMQNNSAICCHHTTTFTQGSGIDWSVFNLNDRQSGYIQYGGSMRSGFMGSATGEKGVIYGSIENPLGIGSDIKTKIQALKYLLATKNGLGLGSDLVESIKNEPSINLQMYNQTTYDTIWTYSKLPSGVYSWGYTLQGNNKKGIIINGDTLK